MTGDRQRLALLTLGPGAWAWAWAWDAIDHSAWRHERRDFHNKRVVIAERSQLESVAVLRSSHEEAARKRDNTAAVVVQLIAKLNGAEVLAVEIVQTQKRVLSSDKGAIHQIRAGSARHQN